MMWWNPLAWNPLTGFAVGTVSIGVFLGLWQWYEKRARPEEVEWPDREYFRRQDLRRWAGIGMMFLLALAIFVVDPRETSGAGRSTRRLVQIANLTGLIGLILGLLALALADVMATYRYARRHRRELANEQAEIMREVIRRAAGSEAISRRGDKKKQGAPEG